jgi:hypothetical protein
MEPIEKPQYAAESQEPQVPRVEDQPSEDGGEPGTRWQSYSLSILTVFFDHY